MLSMSSIHTPSVGFGFVTSFEVLTGVVLKFLIFFEATELEFRVQRMSRGHTPSLRTAPPPPALAVLFLRTTMQKGSEGAQLPCYLYRVSPYGAAGNRQPR